MILSSLLKSEIATEIIIKIMDVFISLRKCINKYEKIKLKLTKKNLK